MSLLFTEAQPFATLNGVMPFDPFDLSRWAVTLVVLLLPSTLSWLECTMGAGTGGISFRSLRRPLTLVNPLC
jgi:hypothetical protein